MVSDIKQIVRVSHTDINGNIPLYHALTKIKGVSYSFANAICVATKLEKVRKIGNLDSQEISMIDDCLKNPLKFNIPNWLLNRKRDVETGIDIHLIGANLKFRIDNDIKFMKRLKTYKGVRHSMGQPVRGQRTKAHFRTGTSVGVQRSKAKMVSGTKERKENK